MSQATPAQAAPSSTAAPTPDGRSTTFQAVEGGTEQHSGANLLVAAYAVLWAILFAWILFMWRRQGAISARVEGLEKAIDRAAAKAEKK